MGDGQIFIKTSAPPSLMMTYRKKLLSARSISLNRTFNITLNSFLQFVSVFEKIVKIRIRKAIYYGKDPPDPDKKHC
jgi:hypothetical protein